MLLVGVVEHAFLSTGLISSGNRVEVAMLLVGIARHATAARSGQFAARPDPSGDVAVLRRPT